MLYTCSKLYNIKRQALKKEKWNTVKTNVWDQCCAKSAYLDLPRFQWTMQRNPGRIEWFSFTFTLEDKTKANLKKLAGYGYETKQIMRGVKKKNNPRNESNQNHKNQRRENTTVGTYFLQFLSKFWPYLHIFFILLHIELKSVQTDNRCPPSTSWQEDHTHLSPEELCTCF